MNKAIFLDRDGVINKEKGDFITSWEDFQFEPGAKEAIRNLKAARYRIIIVSNQSGLGRGIIPPDKFQDITVRMCAELSAAGAQIDGFYFCPHLPDDNCKCRKPSPGLLLQASKKHQIKLSSSYMIGDSVRDIIAGKSAGCGTIYILSGKDGLAGLKHSHCQPDFIANNLREASELLLRNL